MRKGFEVNNVADVEAKLTERMNDVVKALTKSMADRLETRKNFKLLEK